MPLGGHVGNESNFIGIYIVEYSLVTIFVLSFLLQQKATPTVGLWLLTDIV